MKVHFPIFQSKFYQWTRLWARDKSCQWIKISLGNIYEDIDGHFLGHYWFLGGPWSSKQEQIEDLLNVDLSASRPNPGIFVPTRPAPTHPLMANLCWTPRPPKEDLIEETKKGDQAQPCPGISSREGFFRCLWHQIQRPWQEWQSGLW